MSGIALAFWTWATGCAPESGEKPKCLKHKLQTDGLGKAWECVEYLNPA